MLLQGKNRPSRRVARKKDNIIEDKKPGKAQLIAEQERARQQQQGKGANAKYAPNAGKVHGEGPAAKKEAAIPEEVPRALHTFYRKS